MEKVTKGLGADCIIYPKAMTDDNVDIYSPFEKIFHLEYNKDHAKVKASVKKFNELDLNYRKKCAARYLWEFMSIHYVRDKIREEHNKNIENRKPDVLTGDQKHQIKINSDPFKKNASIQEMIDKNTEERNEYLSSCSQPTVQTELQEIARLILENDNSII